MTIGIMQGRLVPPVEDRIQCFPRRAMGGRVPARRRGRARLHRVDLRRVRRRREPDRDRRGHRRDARRCPSGTASRSGRSARTTSWSGRSFGRPRPSCEERVERLVWLLGRCAADSASGASSCRSSTRRGSRRTRSWRRSSRRPPACARRRRETRHRAPPRDVARPDALRRAPGAHCRIRSSRSTTTPATALRWLRPRRRVRGVRRPGRERPHQGPVTGRTTVPLGTGDADFPALFDVPRALSATGATSSCRWRADTRRRGRVGATEPITVARFVAERRPSEVQHEGSSWSGSGLSASATSGTCAPARVDVEILAYRVRRDSPTLSDSLAVETGQDVESKYDIRVFNDLDAALAERPDAVLVCNPSALHLPVALEAARAGCALFIEKPISDSLDGVAELLPGGRRPWPRRACRLPAAVPPEPDPGRTSSSGVARSACCRVRRLARRANICPAGTPTRTIGGCTPRGPIWAAV